MKKVGRKRKLQATGDEDESAIGRP